MFNRSNVVNTHALNNDVERSEKELTGIDKDPLQVTIQRITNVNNEDTLGVCNKRVAIFGMPIPSSKDQRIKERDSGIYTLPHFEVKDSTVDMRKRDDHFDYGCNRRAALFSDHVVKDDVYSFARPLSENPKPDQEYYYAANKDHNIYSEVEDPANTTYYTLETEASNVYSVLDREHIKKAFAPQGDYCDFNRLFPSTPETIQTEGDNLWNSALEEQ